MLSQGDFVRLHVLDNASSDGTSAWLSELAAGDARVQLTLRKHNAGAERNFREGFQAVRTPYLVPLADDDELAPQFLASALPILAQDKDIACVVCSTEVRRGSTLLGYSPGTIRSGRLEPPEHVLEWGKQGHYVSWSSILWRSESILKHINEGEWERYGLPSDVYLQFLVFSESPVYLSDRVGSVFNQHDGQASASIGPELIPTYAMMVESMKVSLSKNKILTDEQQVQFLNCVCLKINDVIESACENRRQQCGAEDIRKWTLDYMNGLAVYTPNEDFPLLPLFRKYHYLRGDLLKLQDSYSKLSADLQQIAEKYGAAKKAALDAAATLNGMQATLNRMEGSLSWRLTYPLRMMHDFLSSRLNKHGS